MIKFLRSEECKHLKKETSFAKGSVGSFLIETSISDETIKQNIEKMGKMNKCFNLILNNAHAVYVYTVLEIFKEVEIPKGNKVKNKNINNLMNQIFKTESASQVTKKKEKQKNLKNLKHIKIQRNSKLIQKLMLMTGMSQVYSVQPKYLHLYLRLTNILNMSHTSLIAEIACKS